VTDKARPIERIRAKVEQVQKEHVELSSDDRFRREIAMGNYKASFGFTAHIFGPCKCGGSWPCPTLCLAEDKLKLAEALDALMVKVDRTPSESMRIEDSMSDISGELAAICLVMEEVS
jgi:hypothetical protein